MKPSDSGSAMSNAPMPFGDEITGIPSLWANSVSSRLASDSVTPWPMNSTGGGAAALRSKRRRRRRQLDLVVLLKHVERHVDVLRPRPAGQHRGHRLAQR